MKITWVGDSPSLVKLEAELGDERGAATVFVLLFREADGMYYVQTRGFTREGWLAIDALEYAMSRDHAAILATARVMEYLD